MFVEKSITIELTGQLGLPNNIREHMLQHGLAEVALTLDVLYYVGFRDGHWVTNKEIQDRLHETGVVVSPRLIRRALKCSIFQGKRIITRRRGRPEYQYRVPGVSSLASKFTDGYIGYTDVLSKEMMICVSDYRRGLHLLLIRRRPGHYSRKWLGDRLGVSGRTTRRYERGTNIRVVPQFKHVPIRSTNLSQIPQRNKGGRAFLTVWRDWNPADVIQMPLVRALAAKWIGRGAVMMTTRQINYYEVA